MNLFQIVAVFVVGTLFVLSLLAMLRRWATRRESLLWALVWLTAAVAIIWPDVTGRLAKALGIGRGADLVLYCSVVVMMIGFLMVYTRLRHLRRELTLVVRALAIRDAVVRPPPPASSPPKTEDAPTTPA
jgi:hypothetical protein